MIIKIFFLIFVVFVVLIVKKYSLNRYIKININPQIKFETYNNIQRVNKKEKVIISFTTLPSRIEFSIYMLSSIFSQTRRVDEIRLYIPKRTRSDMEYKIPLWMKRISKKLSEFRIIICDKDWGPATKIIPAVIDEKDTDTYIIYLDDDMIYHPKTIENLIYYSNIYPKRAISNSGKNGILEGFSGCIVRSDFFNIDKLISTHNYPSEVFYEDDVYISGMLEENNIKKIITEQQYSIPYFYEFITGYILRINPLSLSSTFNKDRKNFKKTYNCFKWNY